MTHPPETLVVVGSSHKTAPLEMLASLSFPPEEIERLLPELKEKFSLSEALFLSTCNRSEIYAVSSNAREDADKIKNYLLELSKNRCEMDPTHFYDRSDNDAVNHLFRVICGLDSLILGETEIAAQVHEALTIAQKTGVSGSYLIQLISGASKTGKRARNETSIGAGTTSVASAAVHMARRVFGDMSLGTVMIVGAGETAKLVGKHLVPAKPRRLIITNRTQSRAKTLASELGAEVAPFGEWDNILPDVDVIVCATHSPTPLITRSLARKAVGPSESRILLLIDISLPHNIEKSVTDIDNVFLYDMTDLKSIVKKNLDRRAKEIDGVEHIIEEEQRSFVFKQATIEIGPTIRDLRESFETVREQELERFISKFQDGDREVAERLTKDLVNKLLHKPTVELRALGSELDENKDKLSWVRRLFGLDRG